MVQASQLRWLLISPYCLLCILFYSIVQSQVTFSPKQYHWQSHLKIKYHVKNWWTSHLFMIIDYYVSFDHQARTSPMSQKSILPKCKWQGLFFSPHLRTKSICLDSYFSSTCDQISCGFLWVTYNCQIDCMKDKINTF